MAFSAGDKLRFTDVEMTLYKDKVQYKAAGVAVHG
jgi:hypothetical protein